MKKSFIYITSIIFSLVTIACGGKEKNSTSAQPTDSVKVDTPKVVTAHPDTSFASAKTLKVVKIDTFLNNISGQLENFDNQYKGSNNILTFRGNPSRETSFSGKITGTPSIVKVD